LGYSDGKPSGDYRGDCASDEVETKHAGFFIQKLQSPSKLLNDEIISPEKKESAIDTAEIISSLWSSRKQIAYFVGIATVLAIVISLLMPNSYRSAATLLPETEKSKLASLGGMSDLASLAGLSVGEGSLVKLYPKIILSESVLKNVIYAEYYSLEFKDSVNLIQYWKIKGKTPELIYESTLKSLRAQLEVSMDNRTNFVSISIAMEEPQLSADVVNKVTSELDRFVRTKRTTNASEQRNWIQSRLVEVKKDLEKSENTLKEFRENNRRIIDSPQLLLEQERLIREVQINSTLYTELKKQFELVKIEEIKNIPIINILDAGRAAANKESPKRAVIVVITFLLATSAACGYVLLLTKYRKYIRGFVERVRARGTSVGRRS
jgi:uncharacterized protein involved in exopolysaccharide biosynthesis